MSNDFFYGQYFKAPYYAGNLTNYNISNPLKGYPQSFSSGFLQSNTGVKLPTGFPQLSTDLLQVANSNMASKKENTNTAKNVVGAGIIMTGLLVIADYAFCKGKHVKQLVNKAKNVINSNSVKTHSESAKPVIKETVKPVAIESAKPVVKETVKPAKNNVIAETFEFIGKDGKKHSLTLEKEIAKGDGPFGEVSDIIYSVKNAEEVQIGHWAGQIQTSSAGDKVLHGGFINTKYCGIKTPNGLGSKMKEFILKEAKNAGCSSINIEAAFASHTFHNKMGYRVNFIDERLYNAKGLLNKVKFGCLYNSDFGIKSIKKTACVSCLKIWSVRDSNS